MFGERIRSSAYIFPFNPEVGEKCVKVCQRTYTEKGTSVKKLHFIEDAIIKGKNWGKFGVFFQQKTYFFFIHHVS